MNYCKTVHLDSGEVIIGMVRTPELDLSNVITTVFHPVRLIPIPVQIQGIPTEILLMKKLAPTSDDEVVDIQTAKILYMASVREQHAEQYVNFLQEHDDYMANQQNEQSPEIESGYSSDAEQSQEEGEDSFENTTRYDTPTQKRTIH